MTPPPIDKLTITSCVVKGSKQLLALQDSQEMSCSLLYSCPLPSMQIPTKDFRATVFSLFQLSNYFWGRGGLRPGIPPRSRLMVWYWGHTPDIQGLHIARNWSEGLTSARLVLQPFELSHLSCLFSPLVSNSHEALMVALRLGLVPCRF